MKLLVYLNFIAVLPSFCFADAGFNLGRPKAVPLFYHGDSGIANDYTCS